MGLRSISGGLIDRDTIGNRGQQFASIALTEPVEDRGSLFLPQFLGDKYPTIDFIVELIGTRMTVTPFFFVQVKATRLGLNQSGNLPIRVNRTTVANLIAYPVPTYVIGVDDRQPVASYIVAVVAGGPTHFPSLPTTHRLDEQTLKQLYDEVQAFWEQNAATFSSSLFT